MGNRAVITTPEKKIGIYLHWNGGRDTVEPLLTYCKLKGVCPPEQDNYGWADFIRIVRNTLGSIGVDCYENLDTNNYDNGVYIIEEWEIVGREFFRGREQCEYSFNDVLHWINRAQPENEQIDLSDYPESEE